MNYCGVWEALVPYHAEEEQVMETHIEDKGDFDKEDKGNEWKVVQRKKKNGQVKILRTIEPEGLCEVKTHGEWTEIELAVDSGATETVMNEDMLAHIATRPGPASRKGVRYEVANGTMIPNLGEKQFRAISEEGAERGIIAQICDVNKGLLSVKKMTKAGNRVVFDEDGSFIEDKQSGERMWMKENEGMYMLKLWVSNSTF